MERDLVSRKRKRIVAVAVAVLVIAITATVTTVALYQHQEKSKVPLSHGELSDSLTSVPLDVYNQVGAGSASLQIQATGEKSDGSTKANFLYIGAEFCPFCAMERLSLTAALSRLGKFENLHDTISGSAEGKLSNIPTVTYKNYAYKSNYVNFKAFEIGDREGREIADIPKLEKQIFAIYSPNGGIPLTYWGDIVTFGPDSGTLLAGIKGAAVASALTNPNSKEAQSTIGGANLFSAEICSKTGGKPENVCSSSGVRSAAKRIR